VIKKIKKHDIQTLVHILSQLNPVQTLTLYLFKIKFNFIFQPTSVSPKRSLTFNFTDKDFVCTLHFSHRFCHRLCINLVCSFLLCGTADQFASRPPRLSIYKSSSYRRLLALLGQESARSKAATYKGRITHRSSACA
jgi:hypothetical protein